MSSAAPAQSERKGGRALKLTLGLLLVIAAGIALAWVGVRSVRQNTVQVETIQAGSGPNIGPQDGVMIEYVGRLANGTVFESTEGKGPVPILPSQTIPGFAEGLYKMQKGGRYTLSIPSKLAYGSNPPAGGPIPPDTDLEFDVHVVQIVPNAATMQGPPQQ